LDNKPISPANRTYKVLSQNEISLSWKDNSDNEDGFILERKEEGGSYILLVKLPKDTNKYIDKNLLTDKTYFIELKHSVLLESQNIQMK